MKSITSLLILLLLLGCKNEVKTISENKSSYLTVTYPSSDSLFSSLLLRSYNLVPEEYNNSLIQIDSNGSFNIQIKIEYPQALTIIGNRISGPLFSNSSQTLFIFPGDTLTIDFSDSITVKANNLLHQNFINNYIALIDEIQLLRNGLNFHESVKSDSPEIFKSKQLEFCKQLKDSIRTFIIKKNIRTKDFIDMAYLEADLVVASHLIDYKLLNSNIYQRTRLFPKDYFRLADSLANINNIKLITHEYFNFLNRLQILYPIEQIDSLSTLIEDKPNSLTRDILIGRGLISVLNKKNIKEAKKYFDFFNDKIESTIIKQSLNDQYDKKLQFINNPQARNAFLTDLSYKTDTNSVIKKIVKDHEGKVVYIKFWGPWCGPCIEEVPYDRMLIHQLDPNKFSFVNLCVKTKKEDWEFTITNKNISGYHYFLNDDQFNKLCSIFKISGIPFHVVIGKDGKVVDNNAPSSGSTLLNGLDQGFLERLKVLCNQE